MWTAVIANYARPGDRVLISDTGPGVSAVQAALDHGCSVAARVPSRIQRIGARIDLRERTTRQQRRAVNLFGGRTGAEAEPRLRRPAPVSWPARARRAPADLMIIPPPCPDEAQLPQPWTRVNPGRLPRAATAPAGIPRWTAGHPWTEAPVDPVLHWQRQLVRDGLALVRPGGVIAVLTRDTPHPEGMVDRLRPLIAHAQQLGLTYLQHNVLVHATLTGDRLLPAVGADDRARSVDLTTPAEYATWMRLGVDRHPIPDPPTTWVGQPQPIELGPVGEPLPHMPIHTNLVVFTVPATAVANASAEATGRACVPEGLQPAAEPEGAAA